MFRADFQDPAHIRSALVLKFLRTALKESLEARGRGVNDLLQRSIAGIAEGMHRAARHEDGRTDGDFSPFSILKELGAAFEDQEPFVLPIVPMGRRAAA